MRYLIWKIVGIVLGVATLVVGYIYWDDIKVGAKNALEWVQETKDERGAKKSESAPLLTGDGFVE